MDRLEVATTEQHERVLPRAMEPDDDGNGNGNGNGNSRALVAAAAGASAVGGSALRSVAAPARAAAGQSARARRCRAVRARDRRHADPARRGCGAPSDRRPARRWPARRGRARCPLPASTRARSTVPYAHWRRPACSGCAATGASRTTASRARCRAGGRRRCAISRSTSRRLRTARRGAASDRTLATGRNAFEGANGASLWQWFDAHPDERRPSPGRWWAHRGRRAGSSRRSTPSAEVRRLCDVGGGRGTLLSELLLRHPHLRGVLCDGGA